jgi:hypothetical protein
MGAIVWHVKKREEDPSIAGEQKIKERISLPWRIRTHLARHESRSWKQGVSGPVL